MSLHVGFVQLISADDAFQAAAGDPNTRIDKTNGIFPATMPQNCDLPALVYARVSGREFDTLDGRGELKQTRVQFSAFGEHHAEAEAAAVAAKNAFVGFSGTLPEGTEVDSVILVLDRDNCEQVPRLYEVSFDVEILYRNAAV